jgi:GT2 family glycosyltransferase
MLRTSVIIVNWNGEARLGDCLHAILAQVGSNDQVIVVDNHSADGSVALVREQFPQVHLIKNERHLGLAGGYNVGLRAAQGAYLLLVSQDVTVHAGWLKAMLEALVPSGAGIAGCKLLGPDGTIQRAGGAIGYPLALPDGQGYREPDEQHEVECVTGAAMGLKRALLDEIGLFDEGFFPACYEETDLCFRARAAGYQIIYTPKAVGIHHETTTIDQGSAEYQRWMNRGRLRFVLKHYTAEQFRDDFVPAERSRLAGITELAVRQGLRTAYLDTVLNLRDMPKTGILADEGNEEAVAEALLSLRETLSAFFDGLRDPLVEPPWRIHEPKIPILGPIIARLRGLWDSVWRSQEKFAVVQEILASMDREATESRRIQAETMYSLQEESDRLQSRVRALEETSSKRLEEG